MSRGWTAEVPTRSVIDRVPDARSRSPGTRRTAARAARRSARPPMVAGPTSTRPRGRPPRGRRAPPTRSRRRRRRDRRTRHGRPAAPSISIRLRTPAVRPRGDSSGTAVGRTDAASDPSGSIEAEARSRMILPCARASRWSARLTVVIPGPAGPPTLSGRVGIARRVEPAIEGEPGEDDELVDRVVALDVARWVGLGVARGAAPRRATSA